MAKPKAQALAPVDPERQRQVLEGRNRAYLEGHEESSLHEDARYELHHLKTAAVRTLDVAMKNTTQCGSCGESGVYADKTAVMAALGVLDRAGLPPAKHFQIEDKRPVRSMSEPDMIARAADALLSLDGENLGLIVHRILAERPDARPWIENALAGQLQLGSGVPA